MQIKVFMVKAHQIKLMLRCDSYSLKEESLTASFITAGIYRLVPLIYLCPHSGLHLQQEFLEIGNRVLSMGAQWIGSNE